MVAWSYKTGESRLILSCESVNDSWWLKKCSLMIIFSAS